MFTSMIKLVFLLCIRVSLQKFSDYSLDIDEDCQSVDLNWLTEINREFSDNDCNITFSNPSCCFVAHLPNAKSGVYSIANTTVYCDTRGGWITFLRRSRNLDNNKFNQTWKRYTRNKGFGVLSGDYWKGLDMLHWLTKTYNMELQIELWNYNTYDPVVMVRYDSFHVGGPNTYYQLTLGTFSGDSSLDGFSDHNNSRFSTPDLNRNSNEFNCAQAYGGGWWYNQCYSFLPTSIESTILGEGFDKFDSVEMKIRSTDCRD